MTSALSWHEHLVVLLLSTVRGRENYRPSTLELRRDVLIRARRPRLPSFCALRSPCDRCFPSPGPLLPQRLSTTSLRRQHFKLRSCLSHPRHHHLVDGRRQYATPVVISCSILACQLSYSAGRSCFSFLQMPTLYALEFLSVSDATPLRLFVTIPVFQGSRKAV